MMWSTSCRSLSSAAIASASAAAVSKDGAKQLLQLSGRRRRTYSVYVMGEGWTGALGTGRLDQSIPGHTDDDDDADAHSWMDDYSSGSIGDASNDPVKIHEDPDGKVLSASAGWGHTALIVSPRKLPQDSQTSAATAAAATAANVPTSKLVMCGRPHDLQALLRLRRLPKSIRNFAVNTTRIQMPYLDRMINFITGMSDEDITMWEFAKQQSMLPVLTELPFPDGDSPAVVKASAGLTAVIGTSGMLYTMGSNNRGQCGIGRPSNHVWTPTPVTGFLPYEGEKITVSIPKQRITRVELGLQHGLCINDHGQLFSWGKGVRGQLGQGDIDESLNAVHVPFYDAQRQRLFSPQPAVRQIGAGLNFGAALLHTNEIYLWGKNILPAPPLDTRKSRIDTSAVHPHKQDAIRPQATLKGLPSNKEVLQISCGLHHIAILLEDGSVYGAGVPVDEARTILENPILLVPPGVLELPLQQFTAHFDRTTMVSRNGSQVLQCLLCADESLRDYATFTPPWVDRLLDRKLRIQEVHRGWLHTVVITK